MTDTDVQVTPRFNLGDLVQKKANSKWRGVVVGFYETENTPIGYSVKSLFETGSVQVWPEAALIPWDGEGTPAKLEADNAALRAENEALRLMALAARELIVGIRKIVGKGGPLPEVVFEIDALTNKEPTT